ncbi:HNH endonuclease [Undibacterium fentianense]|uniref:HNH endonuclease n=1 Tax=Undibacterium fentianense TaxID=2828728 RepID=A0A941IBF8_9BURK|nr:HNH endonuclease [Undibacterium fentianense]MBR7799009.1 HNH endonuclease [Undibacterium fentianense]
MELVETFKEAEENSVRFFDVGSFASSAAFSRLGQFYHWYYFPDTGVFAPSKFIGYKNTSLESYAGEGTGTDTQGVLSRWFHKLDRNTPMYSGLESKLSNFLNEHGFSLSKKTIDGTGGIYVPIGTNATTRFPDEITDESYSEGSVKSVVVNAYERNPKARDACLAHYGNSCYVCGFNFGDVYGDIGNGFIHVHHLKEISSIGREYKVDPIKDLRPLCPNCHAMVHTQKPAISPEELKRRLARA